MDGSELIEQARHEAGLSQEELARRAGTSRPTLSAYENGRKSPALSTAVRVLAEAGFELTITPLVTFVERPLSRGRVALVPLRLPRLSLEEALARVRLPFHLNWSDPGRVFDLGIRAQRARVYEIVLREGRPQDVQTYIDGALLVDLWNDLVLPRDLRSAWTPAVGRLAVDAA